MVIPITSSPDVIEVWGRGVEVHCARRQHPRGSETMAEAMDTDTRSAPQPTPEVPETGAARIPDLPLAVRPTCIICMGMAGSGKTTFIQVRSN